MADLTIGTVLARALAPVAKAGPPVPVSDNRGGWHRIFESFTGAWQKNVTVEFNSVLAYHAVYACITLIASDIAKLRVKLIAKDSDGIWSETTNPAYSPVLRKPNHFQNRIQFWEGWMLSKLTRGNTYVLKERDNRGGDGKGNVIRLYVLDPNRVRPMVSDDGSIYYQLSTDNLAGLEDDILVPASEIIHDRMNCLFHPLVGTSPIFACGVSAMQGIAIQNNATRFFANRSMPGGILTAPGAISGETAQRLKAAWEANYSGENAGKIAVVGDALKFEPIAMTAQESQLIEQLRWTSEVVCSTYHVPGYKIGVGTLPSNANVESLNLEYYTQALQRHIEDAELCLDEGLGLSEAIGVEFDLEGLLRMDTQTLVNSLVAAVGGKLMTTNEGRRRLNLGKTAGGDVVYAQQQDFSLAALAERDANDPFSKPEPAPQQEPVALIAPPEAEESEEDKMSDDDKAIIFGAMLQKSVESVRAAV